MDAEVIIRVKVMNICSETDVSEDFTFIDAVENVMNDEGLSSMVAQHDCDIVSIKEFKPEVKKYHGFTRDELQKIVDTGKCPRIAGECTDCFCNDLEINNCHNTIKKWLADNPIENKEICNTCENSKWYTGSGDYECPPGHDPRPNTYCSDYKEYIPEEKKDYPDHIKMGTNFKKEKPVENRNTHEDLNYHTDPDGYFYPTKDNLCVTDILTGSYVFEIQNKISELWHIPSTKDRIGIIATILRGVITYRFKLQKTEEQLIDEEVQEIIRTYSGSSPDCFDVDTKELMKICLKKRSEK